MKRTINAAQLDIFKPEEVNKRPDTGKVTEDIKSEIRRRRLKIQYGHYNNSRRNHPVIRLAGCWLRNFHFQIGDSVEVEITKGHISITKVPVKK